MSFSFFFFLQIYYFFLSRRVDYLERALALRLCDDEVFPAPLPLSFFEPILCVKCQTTCTFFISLPFYFDELWHNRLTLSEAVLQWLMDIGILVYEDAWSREETPVGFFSHFFRLFNFPPMTIVPQLWFIYVSLFFC